MANLPSSGGTSITMSKIVFLGDSLTADIPYGEKKSWVKKFCTEYDFSYKNLAVTAGNNKTQVIKLQHYLLSDEYDKNDIFFWEINASSRVNVLINRKQIVSGKTLEDAVNTSKESEFNEHITDVSNVFGNDNYGMILCQPHLTLYRKFVDPYDLQNVEEFVLQEVLSQIKLLSQAGHLVIVVLGWRNCLAENHKEIFFQQLNKTNAHIVDAEILEWCIDQNLPIDDDGLHPDQLGAILLWAKAHLLPILKK